MTKKAYLVDMVMTVRVVADENIPEEELLQKALEKFKYTLDHDGIENIISWEEDEEVPYDPSFDNKIN